MMRYKTYRCLEFSPNGATSMNANSFPTVTLLLKVLLQQTNLDKPFSGGLGSYKLYVMVAHHFQKHLELGGGDSPGELFLTFLYRYSDVKLSNIDPRAKTDISEPTIIICDGGEADLNSGVKLDRCVRLFGECFNRIMYQLYQQHNGVDTSTIASLIDGSKLKNARRKCIEMAMQWKKMKGPKVVDPSLQMRESSNAPRRGISFSKTGPNLFLSFNGNSEDNNGGANQEVLRGPRGGLIPKCRPDIDAKPSGVTALLLRGRKNRKNNKKQKRDAALREFATLETE